MAFKKLEAQLLENLNNNGMEEPTSFQKKIISKIKSGSSIFGIGPKDCGKTTSLVIGAIQKCKAKPVGDNPRVLIFVKDKNSVDALAERFKQLTYHTDLRVVTINEEHNIAKQKETGNKIEPYVINKSKEYLKYQNVTAID